MKLKELKCKNCGANLEIEENIKTVTCNFCHTTFSVEDTYNENYNSTKGKLQAIDDHYKLKGIRKAIIVIAAIIFVFLIIFIVSIALNIFNVGKKQVSDSKSLISDNKVEGINENFNADYFNNQYSIYIGTQKGFVLKNCIDKIVTNNKTNDDHGITVKYNGMEIEDSDELVSMKQNIDDITEYEVSFDYDEEGYIDTITIS